MVEKSSIWKYDLFLLLLHGNNVIIRMPLVSIIVPIYNAETYIPRCVDSILAQTFADFELLLVNDGSSDGSLDVCQQYAAKDSRVRVLDKPNGGVSSARNLGLESAKAEWVMFADADDWIEPNTLELAVLYVGECDIVRMAWVAHLPGGVIKNKPIRDAKTPKELLKHLICRKGKLAIWGSLIRRDLFIRNNIRFDASYRYAEDWLAHLRIACRCRGVKTLPNAYVYHYDMANMESCINNMSIEKRACNVRLCHDIKPDLKGRFSKESRDTLLKVYLELIAEYGMEATCEHIRSIRQSVDFFTLWEVLIANFGWRKKRELFAFWRFAQRYGLK
jgi:glycosyltransferase involved in cell wall biosynthesis